MHISKWNNGDIALQNKGGCVFLNPYQAASGPNPKSKRCAFPARNAHRLNSQKRKAKPCAFEVKMPD